MNNSSHEASPRDDQTSSADALLDELDAVMFRMGRLMTSRHGADPSPAGLSPSQYMALRALHDEGPVRASALATCLGVKAPAVSMLLQSLADKGLIGRTPGDDDRRVTMVSLTSTGRGLVLRAESERRALMRRYTSRLTAQELRTYIALNNKIADAVTNGSD